MGFDEVRFGGAIVVGADQRIDLSNADAFRDTLTAAVAAAPTAVIVDMSRADYISSAGLRALTIAQRAAKAASKVVVVAGLSPLVEEIFTISRFNLVFSIYASVREALQGASPDGLGQFDAGVGA
jgi:anti-anti-sigma factor